MDNVGQGHNLFYVDNTAQVRRGFRGMLKTGVSDEVKVRYGFWDAGDSMFCVLRGIINLSFLTLVLLLFHHYCRYHFSALIIILSSHPSISFIVPDECCHTRPMLQSSGDSGMRLISAQGARWETAVPVY